MEPTHRHVQDDSESKENCDIPTLFQREPRRRKLFQTTNQPNDQSVDDLFEEDLVIDEDDLECLRNCDSCKVLNFAVFVSFNIVVWVDLVLSILSYVRFCDRLFYIFLNTTGHISIQYDNMFFIMQNIYIFRFVIAVLNSQINNLWYFQNVKLNIQ